MNIYELNYQFKQIALMAEDPDVTADEIAEQLEALKGNLEEFADNAVKMIANLKADVTALKAEGERLMGKRRMKEARIASLEVALKQALELAGVRKIHAGTFDVSIARNGGKAPVVLTAELDQLPDEFFRTRREFDSEALRKYIEETGDIAYGYIGERGESVRIR